MKRLKLIAIALFVSALALAAATKPGVVKSQVLIQGQPEDTPGPTEAPAAFDDQTNGFEPQGDPNTPETFLADKAAFEVRETKETGLGPVYNAQSCAECHQNPVTGGISQITELRAGHSGPHGEFVEAPGGSIIQARAVDPRIQERVPDGPRIVYQNPGGIAVMGFDGGQYGLVGNTPVVGLYPSFSPDGTQIVFQRNVAGNVNNIFVMKNDGKGLRQLTTTQGQDASPAWSPDGTKIAFASRRTGSWQIFLMNPDGTNQVNISNNTNTSDLQPAWSHDGRFIAFSRVSGDPFSQPGHIWRMNSDGTGQLPLTNTPLNDERPTWSPDDTMIAFHRNHDGQADIFKMDNLGAVQTQLTNSPAFDQFPSWSPDGSAIAFTSNRSGATHIWTMATDGTNQAQVSNQSLPGTMPSYSQDQGETVRTFRSSLNTLGDGFVESVEDATLLGIRDSQPAAMRGTAISVPLFEAPGQTRLGRFGWKDSIASLLTFSAAAYKGEMGITSPLQPNEFTSLGRNVTPFDLVPVLEDDGGPQGFGEDVEAFTRFMRSTKAPPRDTDLMEPTGDVNDAGSQLFDTLSCSVCHVRTIQTAPVGTVLNGGFFTVPEALGNKLIHPYSDFLLHDIGTGDGIVETNGEPTRNMVRTAPLWGLRTRERLMHDAGGSSSAPSNNGLQSFTLNEAILRHAGQATASRNAFQALTPVRKAQLIRFLKSL